MRPRPSTNAPLPQHHPAGGNMHRGMNHTGPERNAITGLQSLLQNDAGNARLFLAVACLWPLALLALFVSSAPHITIENGASNVSTISALSLPVFTSDKNSIRNLLDHGDVLGYSPEHPRVAAVVVGNYNQDNLVSSVESIFKHTDLDRIFIIVVVVDGHQYDADLVKSLIKIDTGAIPHWHGYKPDLNNNNGDTNTDKKGSDVIDEPHGRKVQVIFNENAMGTAASRADAVQFISILEGKHEEVGLKSKDEDLILLLMRSGAQLTSRKWLPMVTDALIVPPPVFSPGMEAGTDAVHTNSASDTGLAMKVANAVAFNLEGSGKRTSFDSTFAPIISEPTADEINLSNGASYPSPALNGAATALRLETFLNLPSQDTMATLTKEDWPADLELSLNLWLCADGIDMLRDLTVTSFDNPPLAPLSPELAARFAAAWMDTVASKKFFSSYTKIYNEVTFLEWETLQAKAQHQPTFTPDLPKKCRSFTWFANEVDPKLGEILQGNVKQEPLDDGFAEEEEEEVENEGDDSPKDQEPNDQGSEDVEAEKEQDKNTDKQNSQDEEQENEIDANELPDLSGRKKPSKPLCSECLKIVRKAEPIDITYVDVSEGHKEHPHLGAMDVDGKLGYVHDETALRKNPPKMHYSKEEIRKGCIIRDNNYRMIHEKVFVDLKAHEEKEKNNEKRDKIFCLVYTIESGHPSVQRIRETWGPKCDGFIVGSNKTDPSVDAVNIVHDGPEEYDNIWQKVRSMWSYIYDNYYEKYDWFHVGGDDMFLIIENLRLYLESEEIKTAANGGIYLPDGTETSQVPLFLGRRFAYQGDMNDIFNSGGAGYTFNKAALKTLVAKGIPAYYPHLHTFSEDTMVARVLRKFGVYPYETKDEAGGERYMPFLPGHHYGYRMAADHNIDWYAKYSINIKEGADHCAARSVAFHYVKGRMMYRLYTLLYHMCPADSVEEQQ